MQITIDGNKEKHNVVRFAKECDNTYDKIVSNVTKALDVGFDIILRINIADDTCLSVNELIESFASLPSGVKLRLHFSIIKVWQASKSLDAVIQLIVASLRKNGFMATSYYSNPTSIWNTCYADKNNHMIINSGGKVYSCTACKFSTNDIEGTLNSDGTLLWNKSHYDRIGASPLNNAECVKFKILPICIGGCKRRIVEGDNISCYMGYSDKEKENYALHVLQDRIIK